MLDAILSQLANGLVLGSLYVMISIGLSVIFGLLGIVNFAHGAFFALGAYLSVTIIEMIGWPAVVLAPLMVAVIGIACELTIIRRLYRLDPLLGLIVTFGLALFIEAVIRLAWGPVGLPLAAPGFLRGFVEYGPIFLTRYRLGVLVATATLLALLWAFFAFTPYGRILRAGSRDPEMVALLGIDFPRVLTGAFGLGCFLAGTAGLLAAPLWGVSPSMGAGALMPTFVIVTIGGLGSYMGAIVGGMLVGVVTTMCVQFVPAASGVAMYVLMAAILLVRPRGLFGERWERFE